MSDANRVIWLVGVPMADPALRSLNLSNTAAVALYEVLRRRAKV